MYIKGFLYSVYANYMQGLTAGDLVDNTAYANNGESLASYKNKNYWNAMSNNPALYVGKGRTAVVSLETKF